MKPFNFRDWLPDQYETSPRHGFASAAKTARKGKAVKPTPKARRTIEPRYSFKALMLPAASPARPRPAPAKKVENSFPPELAAAQARLLAQKKKGR